VLRITEHNNSHTTTLKLEGKLLQAWAAELRQAASAAQARARPVQLDLQDLDYVDLHGADLLRELVAQGATISSCSGFVSELLERNRAR
jgi:ABC-type transporter Mla MlaB component